MGDPKGFVEDGIEANVSPPPVIVILAALAVEEEPAVIDLPSGPDDRHTGTVDDSELPLFLVGQVVPLVDGQFGKGDGHPPGAVDRSVAGAGRRVS